MIGERTNEGWLLTLRTRDAGRFFSVPFLLLCLCGWALGESIVLYILIRGAWALLTGTPTHAGREPLQLAPALAVGAFLLLWVSFWTLGGIAAISELLRLLWGEDRLLVASGRLTVTWSRGPFKKTRAFERDAIQRIVLVPPRDQLALQSRTQRIELSRLGTPAERREAVAALMAELGIAAATDAAPIELPQQWEAIVTPEGERALVPNAATRQTQARVAATLAMGAAAITFLIARGIPRDWALAVPAAIVLMATLALTWGALWLARGRWEWRIGGDRLTLRKRWGGSARDVFETHRLRLDSTSDSDGDVWYSLYAMGPESDAGASPRRTGFRPAVPKGSKTIAKVMNDPMTVRELAVWLVREANLAFEDRTTPEAREAELAELRKALEGSGKLGQLAAKWVVRLETNVKKAKDGAHSG